MYFPLRMEKAGSVAAPKVFSEDPLGKSRRLSDVIKTQVDPTSDLAGYTYEDSHGRFATFFWQCVSDDYEHDSKVHSLG